MPFRGIVAYADPLRAGRHPAQVFLLVLCVVSGIPLVLGEPTAQSVEALLPGWMALGWGLSLSLGAALALVGTYWRSGYATALTLERIGVAAVGYAAVVYAALILVYAGLAGVPAAPIVAGFGVGFALRRSRDIGRVMARAIALREDGNQTGDRGGAS